MKGGPKLGKRNYIFVKCGKVTSLDQQLTNDFIYFKMNMYDVQHSNTSLTYYHALFLTNELRSWRRFRHPVIGIVQVSILVPNYLYYTPSVHF